VPQIKHNRLCCLCVCYSAVCFYGTSSDAVDSVVYLYAILLMLQWTCCWPPCCAESYPRHHRVVLNHTFSITVLCGIIPTASPCCAESYPRHHRVVLNHTHSITVLCWIIPIIPIHISRKCMLLKYKHCIIRRGFTLWQRGNCPPSKYFPLELALHMCTAVFLHHLLNYIFCVI